MINLTEILLDLLAEKKLCKKGKAYYNRRIAAGEKPSAYLSGRAVKVCKGLMEEDDLNEGKQVGTLYHWTNNSNLLNILNTNTLVPNYTEGGEIHKDQSGPYVSFTRSKDKNQFTIAEEANALLIINGDKLSNNYKITPFQDYGSDYEPSDDVGDQFDESEERIYKKTIKNLDKYLIKVILYKNIESFWGKNKFNECIKLLKEKNIPYELNLNESLDDWFEEKWVRIDTQGNITGPCGTMKKGKKTTRCLPRAKANSLTKDERAATSRKKAASNKQFVPNTKKAKVKLSETKDQTIECVKCGWRWLLSTGGTDPYICHNTLSSGDICGYDNSYRYNDDIEEYDVENEQDLKEFIQFIKEYNQMLSEGCDCLLEAEYRGRKVKLGKPMQGDIKKFKVYVKNPKGKVVKVNFGFGGSSAKGKRMNIKKNNPVRRKAYRARHHCDNPGPRHKANYWSCRAW